MKNGSGLGELLRHLCDLVDHGAEQTYRSMGVAYKARYTPVMRALGAGDATITEITRRSHLTQGAISQTVGLMAADGLLQRHAHEDGRKSTLRLTVRGRALLARLEPHWSLTFKAIRSLETETGYPLLRVLEDTVQALERRGFAERMRDAQAGTRKPAHVR